MASYTIATGDIATHAHALSAATDTVTIASFVQQVSVLVHPGSTDAVYVTGDGSAPGPSNGKSRVVFGGSGIDVDIADQANSQVKIFTSGSVTYSVEI